MESAGKTNLLPLYHYYGFLETSFYRRGFAKLPDAVEHQEKRHPEDGSTEVIWPAVSRLLSARCKLRGCKRELVGVTGAEVNFL